MTVVAALLELDSEREEVRGIEVGRVVGPSRARFGREFSPSRQVEYTRINTQTLASAIVLVYAHFHE
jgi:hypothetical protein